MIAVRPPVSRCSEAGQSTTETLLVMSFLMLLVFGVVHMAMLATTKYLVSFAAFNAARTAMIGRSAQTGASSALSMLDWPGSSPVAEDNSARTIRGTRRSGVTVRYVVPFGGIFNLPSPIITGFAPSTRQPDIPEDGDNAD